MQDYEKLGAFYLGRAAQDGDATNGSDAPSPEPLLYDAADLTTHAVIIGMTGSGKTGLGVGLIEEAALDSVPVIAIDPKGDLGNLMLMFPDLAPADFEPWVDVQQAATRGRSKAEFAADQATLWREGLASWDQDGARIQRLKDAAEFAIYTPGSSAGIPISVLGSFAAPAQALRDDSEAFAERIQATSTSILTLLGLDADPLTSRAHILISNILQHSWQADRSLDLAGLIGAIQNPPMERIGVMDMEAIYPAKDRFALAMQLNNVLASPGFAAWTEGVPLSARDLFHTADGKPRVSIVSIAHLSDTERMFFVTLLLNDIIAWMRAQPGTSSLRAILYMDELFGYMPPTANPPSKKLFLTLLKQARAYGLGLVLSTQNPVDLDYKGLSNTGTWFIGRLQTDRDKARVLDGLEGSGSGGGPFDRGAMERTLAGLGKRRFLLHNVHESHPVVFATRWAMSYLPGPLTREQIRRLCDALPSPAVAASIQKTSPRPPAPVSSVATPNAMPVLAPGIRQFYRPATPPADSQLIYYPQVVGAADVVYASKTHDVDTRRAWLVAVDVDDGPVAIDWHNGEALALRLTDLAEKPLAGAGFAEVPAPARDAGQYPKWASAYKTWLRQSQGIALYKNPQFKLTSAVDESETDFRIRLQQKAREQRDLAVGKLRARYDKAAGGLHDKLRAAERDIEEEKAQASQKTMESALSIGSALLGAFLGRKTLSSRNASRIGTAARRAGSVVKERRDVREAEADAAELRARIDEESASFEKELAELQALPGADSFDLETVTVRAKSSDITVRFVALLWLPYAQSADGRTVPAWV
ncbi:ATP-binding protein [Salinisphaera aquimarina]|uniref:Helicase HerA domain-containing protein n=1 Tax=Salinisphaera aquimarina TaxID=2094031 RepID=A0ABV7EN60_9GAMM